MNIYFIILITLLLFSLFLFIIGLKLLINTLNKLSSTKIRQLILKFSKNNVQVLLLGIIITAICQSSNAVTAITLSFVSANYLSLRKGLIIIIGSNIGTTITSIFFSLNIQNYSFLFICLGIIIYILLKNKQIGLFIISLGILLFGLNHLTYYLESILSLDYIKPFLIKFNNSNIICFFFGNIISFLMQSSSGSIGLIQNLYQNNLINLSSGVSFVLGANIGTTITGMFVGLFGNKNARIIGIINFFFNFLGSILFLLLIKEYTELLIFIKNIFNLSNSLTISISHIIYNLITVLIFFIILSLHKNKSFAF